MRIAIASLITALALPAIAEAESRVTVGASVGLWQNEEDANAGIDSSQTLGLWGRFGLTRRVSGQLELAEHKYEGGCGEFCMNTPSTLRSITALVVVDLRDRGPWMPVLLAGMGIDRDESESAFVTEASHIEGGFGLEYRAEGGLTFGADVRMGGRSVDDELVIAVIPPPGAIREGEYRAARVTMGIRF
jgi:hypothetical protein